MRTLNYGPGSVMLSGCFMADGSQALVKIEFY